MIRHALFNVKKNGQESYIDLALLPPCKSVLYLHAQWSDLGAYIWKVAKAPQIIMPNYNESGWYDTEKIQWVDRTFPESVEEILLDDGDKLADEYGCDVLTDDEDDDLSYVFLTVLSFIYALRKICQYTGFLWPEFARIRTEFSDLHCKSLNFVLTQGN